MSEYLGRTKNGASFSGSDMNTWKCIVVATQLKLYAATGIRAHKGWTPTSALLWAGQELGMKFKRGQCGLADTVREELTMRCEDFPCCGHYDQESGEIYCYEATRSDLERIREKVEAAEREYQERRILYLYENAPNEHDEELCDSLGEDGVVIYCKDCLVESWDEAECGRVDDY